jgi:prolipoprotein diacylglyceryl transferase
MSYLATIPSPTQGGWHIFGILIHAYAIAILLGIVAAVGITEYRLRQRGAPAWLTLDVAIFAVPAGIIGARLYHLITSPNDYIGPNGNLLQAVEIWKGGLGIWGGVAGGALGAWWACRRANIPLTLFADALAPGLPVAQAIGRWGNWFNNELYGGHTDLPWGLNVYAYNLGEGRAVLNPDGTPRLLEGGPFQPTFLYESIWDIGVAVLVWLVDRKLKLGRGRAFALYVMAYTVGRFWIEALRTDPANHFLGVRINDWVSLLVFVAALVYFIRVKGPQEHIAVLEDGTLQAVTAEGEPIEWRKSKASDSNADASDDDDDGEAGSGSSADLGTSRARKA